MNSAEVCRYVCSAFGNFERQHRPGIRPDQSWDDLRSELLTWVQKINQDVAFAGLFSILSSGDRYQYQYIAGELLDKANIACPLPLEEFLRRILPHWNLSADTVPRYAARVFGREVVLVLVDNLVKNGSIWPSPGTLDGFRYHLAHCADAS
jgi:hypothetical protein